MFKKAQGLPLTTIVLAILVLIVLITLAIFFFGGFGQTSSGTRTQAAINKCQGFCTTAAYIGDVATIKTSLDSQNFCSVTQEDLNGKRCGEVAPCFIRVRNGTCFKFDCGSPAGNSAVAASSTSGCI